MKREKGFMSEELFRKIADECIENNVALRLIGLGEPFLHKKIIDFVKYVKAKSGVLHITNNGLIITEEHIKKIIEYQLDSIIFSFQGATKEEYEYMRNNKLYDKLLNTIEKFLELRGDKEKPFVMITSTVTERDKKEDIEKFIKFWELKADFVNVGQTVFERFYEFDKNIYNKFGLKRPEINLNFLCVEPFTKLTIFWDGRASGCCAAVNDDLIVGNVRQNSIKEIWNNDIINGIRLILKHKRQDLIAFCRSCRPPYNFHKRD